MVAVINRASDAVGALETAGTKRAMSSKKDTPGNRLEKLVEDRAGQYSIRINRQWWICFSWSDAGSEDVGIVDYR